MTKVLTGICVGGPLDGQSYEAQGTQGFIIPDSHSRPQPVAGTKPSKIGPTVTNYRYRAEIFRTPTKEFVFWVPHNQTIEQTVERLLEVYCGVIAASRAGRRDHDFPR